MFFSSKKFKHFVFAGNRTNALRYSKNIRDYAHFKTKRMCLSSSVANYS
ncbi:unnamed protein product [Acanthoscelides obtectus]|uniref:Uncharacterized protein n=1 Tax=Acanthoscelides obtectus TaxID=200917 RepID=A0A9P0KCS9_ACAOB|nr:unnamed protein product [Acanthoscelides obtectus]CAK1635033.1 hypothetical protein AOBTE_LOCUS9014 [Acanthoscelides obtectus]